MKKAYVYGVIGLISCSMLMYEVLLTRICALRLFFHFGFLVVSNCLLGIGASGSMISLVQAFFAKRERLWIWLFSLLYLISLVLTYLFLLTFNIAAGVNFVSAREVFNFAFFNLVSAIPFFFAGSIIGLILTFNADQINRVYAIDLLGAGLGCLLCPFLLWKTGAGGCLVFLGLLALAGAVAAAPSSFKRAAFIGGGVIGMLGLFILPSLDRWYPIPSKPRIEFTEEVNIELTRHIFYSRWSTTSRVDLSIFGPEVKYIFGRGKNRLADPIPEQRFILQDGGAGTFITNFSENPGALKTLAKTTYGIATALKQSPRVFIIGVGGGNDVWGAQANGAAAVKGIELNQQVLDIHRTVLPNYSQNIIEDPRIELVHDEGRSALMREKARYDVIQMSGIDTYTLLTSGAYMMAENYLYTVEAIENMYDKLTDEGIISITRFAHEMETLRLLATIFAALDDKTAGTLQNSVVCLYTWPLMTTLIKKGPFTAGELAQIDAYAGEEGIDVYYQPAKQLNNVVEQFIRTDDKARFIHDFPRNIAPTTDDCPFFFNFTKWTWLRRAASHINEPTFVSLGNPFFIFGQLFFSILLSGLFILLPVVIFKRKGLDSTYLTRFLIYFTGLGLGFIAIEIALMQKLVLFLGHPLYSITVTLFSMLIFTGVGSLLSERWFRTPTSLVWLVPAGLAALLGLFMLISPTMAGKWITWPQPLRIAVTAAILSPISVLLGIPFAYGIRLLNRFNPTIIPWAWAVNACATVIGSIVAVIFSMNFGFNFVLIAAILIYGVTFLPVRIFAR